MKKFFWSALSSDDRHRAIQETVSVINRYGSITSFLRCSDLSLGLCIETEENCVEKLYEELIGKIKISGDFREVDALSRAECRIMLNVTFIRGTGDLEIENPGIIE